MSTPTPTPATGTPPAVPPSIPPAAPATGTPAAAAGTPAATATGTPVTPQAAGATTETPAPTPAPAVPATYELTLPEGGPLEQSDVDAFVATAKAKQWTNEQAQAALTEYAEGLTAQSGQFLTELQAHPEIGGTHLEQAQQHARRTLDKFLPATTLEGQALRTAMNKSGYGNYAPLVLLLARIGKAMGEDTPVAPSTARTAGQAQRDPAAVLYGG
jgi:hypothetical protein